MGSFEAWRHVVGGVLDVAGVPGFLANRRRKGIDQDEETAAWLTFLVAWRGAFGGSPRTVAAAMDKDPIFEAIPAEVKRGRAGSRAGLARSLGKALSRIAERRFVESEGKKQTLRIE